MRYLVTAQEMKQYDKNTIEYLGIPGPVLMERAALAAEDFLKELHHNERSRYPARWQLPLLPQKHPGLV